MPCDYEFTLKNLVQLALGTPQLNSVNITALHSLLDILLKKLDCEHEKVKIGGFEAKCLHNLLKESNVSALPFDKEKVTIISEQLDKINEIENRLRRVDNQLQAHFHQVRKCNKKDAFKFDLNKWERYENDCEDLCSLCDPENEIACSLIKNTDFLRKLLRRISKPIVERVFELEKKIESLHEELIKFIEQAREEYKKIALIEHAIYEIEMVRVKVNENYTKFIEAMEEVQDMLDAKLDKLHMPALKKYIRERFDALEKRMKAYEEKLTCPKAAGVIMEGISCLSCGSTKIGAEVGVETAGLLPDMPTKKETALPKACICVGVCKTPDDEPRFTQTILKLDVKGQKQTNKGAASLGPCYVAMDSVPLIEGTDGHFYRRG